MKGTGGKYATEVKALAFALAWLGLAQPVDAAKLFVASTGNQVLRYEVQASGAPQKDPVDLSVDTPVGLAFGAGGELFVTSAGASGSFVYRYTTPQAAPKPNGKIQSPSLAGPHWAAFLGTDLVIAQRDGAPVAVCQPSASTCAAANLPGLLQGVARGVAVSPTGEVLVSACCQSNQVLRYVRLANGAWSQRTPTITGNSLASPHDLVFSARGELFVANGNSNVISRFLPDASGAYVANTESPTLTASQLTGTLGLAFSPWGELFVSSPVSKLIQRFKPKGDFTFEDGGKIDLPAGARDIAFAPEAGGAAGVIASVTGIALRWVTCENLTTWQTVTVPAGAPPPWDCKAAGLVTRPGDVIQVRVAGSAQ